MNYYIVINSAGVYPAKAFLARLRLRWPSARVHKEEDFEVPMKQQTLYGSLAHGDKGIVLNGGGIQDCAEFIHWYRSLLPVSEEVLFFDESMAIDCSLKPEMSAAEIEQVIVSS